MNLQLHIKYKHTPADVRICSSCDYSNTNSWRLERHFQRVHTENTIQTCQFCGSVTKNLYQHLFRKQCNKQEELKKVYKCDECHKTFYVNQEFKSHYQSVHLKVKNKSCPHCEYKAYRITNLNSS